jgi:hypothetical protein
LLLEKIAACGDIPNILRNQKVHSHGHKGLPFALILRHTIPVHKTASNFSKINFNIILPYTSRSSWRSLFCRFSYLCRYLLSHACYVACPLLSSLICPNNIGRGVQIITFLIMQFSPASWCVPHLTPKYSPQHPVLKHPHTVFCL